MPRTRAAEFTKAMYHEMSRANRREDSFLEDVDRHNFVKTLATACVNTGWQVHGDNLLRNHYLLVVETPKTN